jgi:uncharacterized protein YkwD
MDTHFSSALRRPRRTLFSRLVVTGMLTSLVVVGGTTSTALPSSAAPTTSSQVQGHPAMAPILYEKRVQRLVNLKRRNHNLAALRLARCTDGAAERWSSHLARNDLFYHQSMQDLLTRCDATYAGETLGRGAITPRRLVRMWMHSEGHRAVLMSSKARRIGIGAKPDAYGRWVVAANFMRF